MPRLDGIDVSKHQGTIDWGRVAAERPDLRFVMIRMSHGGRHDQNLRVDSQGARNRREMRRVYPHTPRGYYHFLGASDPVVQARHFATQVGDLQPGEFVMLDVEEDHPAQIGQFPVAHIVATLDAIEAEFGVTPWLYIPQPGNYRNSDDPRLHRYPLMLPVYAPEERFRHFAGLMGRPTTVWQWGGDDNGVVVDGISSGRIDSNEIMDEARFRASLAPGLADGPEPEPFVPTSEPLGFVRPIGFGDHGNEVFLLQALLVAHGVFDDLDRNRDGLYEDGTRLGVERFQSRRGLPESGRVDATTWKALATMAM